MTLTDWDISWVYGLFAIGMALLFGGGNLLVEGSSKIARILRIHPIIVGLTIVALGTSMPEFLVSMTAAIQEKPDVALGNIIGSNVSNIALILGVSALCRPMSVHLKLLKFEIPLVIGISLFFWIICMNGTLGRLEGLLLTAGFAAYIYIIISKAKAEKAANAHNEAFNSIKSERKKIALYSIYTVLGMICLTFGADWIVNSASEISRRQGVSELTLGLTIVALGTSLPELATSLTAALKKEGDISIGNIIGSNIFNMMAIAGPSAFVNPLPVADELIYNHLPIMLGLTVLLYPILKTGRIISRLEGAILLLCYFLIMTFWII